MYCVCGGDACRVDVCGEAIFVGLRTWHATMTTNITITVTITTVTSITITITITTTCPRCMWRQSTIWLKI